MLLEGPLASTWGITSKKEHQSHNTIVTFRCCWHFKWFSDDYKGSCKCTWRVTKEGKYLHVQSCEILVDIMAGSSDLLLWHHCSLGRNILAAQVSGWVCVGGCVCRQLQEDWLQTSSRTSLSLTDTFRFLFRNQRGLHVHNNRTQRREQQAGGSGNGARGPLRGFHQHHYTKVPAGEECGSINIIMVVKI